MLNHLAILKGVTVAGERKEMVDALLQQTNLWDVRKKALSTYSGGMKQRFGIDPYNKLIDRIADDNMIDVTHE
ncbi:MAG TPA: hypothetical protein VND66_13870 [Acidobacteriaceae bacterium]|nr:hypothetical protein [Acidobacteriaceae bacterium]